jgi:hypothetical protein
MSKTIIITENQYEQLLNDPLLDDAHEDFSFNILKNYPWENCWELDAYCQRCGLTMLGRGAGRIVYALDDGLVMKIANGDCEQNEYEVNVFTDLSDELKELVPVIFAYDKNHIRPLWIVSERVLPAKYVDFKKILGIGFGDYYSSQDIRDEEEDLMTYNKYPSKEQNNELTITGLLDAFEEKSINGTPYKELINNNRWFYLLYYMLDYGYVSSWELGIIENWGLVQRNGKPVIVILDIGI